ncbi:MAG: DUF1805 domain-containing protein [Archaeoglobus sp.]|nr:DUF1805 domain-containing protein [Archaeoglobus sp.]
MKTLFSKSGVEVASLEIEGKEVLGIKIDLEGAPLLIMKGERILVGCAYLNPEILEKMGNAACIVSGVRNFEDVLNAKIKVATSKALEMGAKPGMKARDVL